MTWLFVLAVHSIKPATQNDHTNNKAKQTLYIILVQSYSGDFSSTAKQFF